MRFAGEAAIKSDFMNPAVDRRIGLGRPRNAGPWLNVAEILEVKQHGAGGRVEPGVLETPLPLVLRNGALDIHRDPVRRRFCRIGDDIVKPRR